MQASKPKLLVMEAWALGDLVLAAPFIQAAAQHYEVTLLAKPVAKDLQQKFWPGIDLIQAHFPWTAFRRKYALHEWNWSNLWGIGRELRSRRFDFAVSARWDPRDHFIMRLSGARDRVGFSRLGSNLFLTRDLPYPGLGVHRYEYWRLIGQAIGVKMSSGRPFANTASGKRIVIHTGSSHPLRVWPLDRVLSIVKRLRLAGFSVSVLCDPNQADWWRNQGEPIVVPRTVGELMAAMEGAAGMIGNDSGPGHLAAALGMPTFTIFGDQLSSRFIPLNQGSEAIEGKECAFKPCSDSCRFEQPNCLLEITTEEVWTRLQAWLHKQCGFGSAA